MSPREDGGRGPQGRRAPKTSGPRSVPPPGPPRASTPGGADLDEPDLFRDVRKTLRGSHPLPLLTPASSLLAAVDPREADPFGGRDDQPETPFRSDLVDAFLEVRRPEVTALLGAVAELTDDELERRRIRRELADRPHKPPRWFRRLAPPRVLRALQMSHVLRDGDNVMLDVVTGSDDPMTVLIYIDHNLGTLVKDAFVVENPLVELEREFREMAADEPDTDFVELDSADARARITEAIELGAITFPPLETETWPACRPLIEWVVRHLPAGGVGYVRPDWSEEERDQLVAQFLASPHASHLPVDEAGDLAHVLVWFACDYGPGDPLRWSPVAVEILLTDFLARKAVFPEATPERGPEALRAFVRFAHDECGIRSELSAQTLEGIERQATEFLDQLGGDRRGLGHLLTDLLAGHGFDPTDLGMSVDASDGSAPTRDQMRRPLIQQVGDEETLDRLDMNPLSDEPLDLDPVPHDIQDRVERTAALTDACCDELLDVEYRTACRRFLIDVAANDAEIFRRRSRDETAAAAITWVIAKANGLLEPYSGGLTAKQLAGWFGVGSNVSQRAAPMLRAVGVHPEATYIRLGTTRYLVADARARIIERRDHSS